MNVVSDVDESAKSAPMVVDVDSDIDGSVKSASIKSGPGIAVERRSSIMRMSTARDLLTDEDRKPLSPKEQVRGKRGCFKSLPTHCSNDMVCGSWYELQ